MGNFLNPLFSGIQLGNGPETFPQGVGQDNSNLLALLFSQRLDQMNQKSDSFSLPFMLGGGLGQSGGSNSLFDTLFSLNQQSGGGQNSFGVGQSVGGNIFGPDSLFSPGGAPSGFPFGPPGMFFQGVPTGLRFQFSVPTEQLLKRS